MNIPRAEANRFIRLYHHLMWYAGRRRKIIPAAMTLEEFIEEPLEVKAQCRDKIYARKALFADFIRDEGASLSPEDREMVTQWQRYHVHGDFIALRYWNNYLVLLPTFGRAQAYGVWGLISKLKKLLPPRRLPFLVTTALLPCAGVIVADGLFSEPGVFIGPNMQRDMNDQFDAIRAAGGFITAFPP